MYSDSFRVIDGIFLGIIQFCFNVSRSIWSLLKNPVAGTLRLTARYKQKPASQVSYLTLLFLLSVLSYCFFEVAMDYPIQHPAPYEGMYTRIGKNLVRYFTGSDIVQLTIYGFAFTIGIKLAVES